MKKEKNNLTWNTSDITKDNYSCLSKSNVKKFVSQQINESTDALKTFSLLRNYFENSKNDLYMDKFYNNTESAPRWWKPDEEKIFEFETSQDFFGELFEIILKEKKKIPKRSVWSKEFENALKYFVFNSKIKSDESDFQKSFKKVLILLAAPLYTGKDLEDGQHLIARYKIEQLVNEAKSYWPMIDGGPIPLS